MCICWNWGDRCELDVCIFCVVECRYYCVGISCVEGGNDRLCCVECNCEWFDMGDCDWSGEKFVDCWWFCVVFWFGDCVVGCVVESVG